MSDFDLVYQAAKKRDAKTISLLSLDDHSYIYERKELDLTPAGQCAAEGDWASACWLMTEFKASINDIVYGAIIGGQITSLQSPMDALPEFLRVHLTNRDWRYECALLKAFAQQGDVAVITEYLRDNATISSHAIEAAALGAAYGNWPEVLTFLLETYPKKRSELLCQMLKGAAWGGHQALLLQCLAHYNGEKGIFPQDIDYHARLAIMEGCGSGGQFGLLTSLLTSRATIMHDLDVYHACKSAAFYKHDHFITKLLTAHPRLLEYIQLAMATMQHIDYLEPLLTQDTNFGSIANFVKDKIWSKNALFNYLIDFTQPVFAQKLCQALALCKKIDPAIIKAMPEITQNALKVINFKSRYGITTMQARFLYEHPERLQLIVSAQYDREGLYNLVKNQAHLNHWQFMDLVKRVQKNNTKSQLIDDLENYLNTKTGWWYNHRERCTSFLAAVRETKNHKACRELVGAQCRLFSAAPVSGNVSINPNTPKHTLAVTQHAVKDGYYKALKKYQDTVVGDSSLRT